MPLDRSAQSLRSIAHFIAQWFREVFEAAELRQPDNSDIKEADELGVQLFVQTLGFNNIDQRQARKAIQLQILHLAPQSSGI